MFKRISALFFVFVFCVSVSFSQKREKTRLIKQTKDKSTPKKQAPQQKSTQEKQKKQEEIWQPKYIPIRSYENTSPLELASLDLLIPGYGMYQLDRYGWSIGYSSTKLLGAFFIFLSVRNYLFWKGAADQFVNARSLASRSQFNIPEKSTSLTAREILNHSDRALLWIIFTSAFEILVYGVSFWHTLAVASHHLEHDGTFYRINIESDSKSDYNEMNLEFGYKFLLR